MSQVASTVLNRQHILFEPQGEILAVASRPVMRQSQTVRVTLKLPFEPHSKRRNESGWPFLQRTKVNRLFYGGRGQGIFGAVSDR